VSRRVCLGRYVKLEPELGRVGLAQGLGLWVLPTHREMKSKRGHASKKEVADEGELCVDVVLCSATHDLASRLTVFVSTFVRWYNDHVHRVVDLISLAPSSLGAIRKAFQNLDADQDGLVSDEDMLSAIVSVSNLDGYQHMLPHHSCCVEQKLKPNKFTLFMKKFLVPGKHAADRLDFGEWLHFVTRVCLLGNPQMVRHTLQKWTHAAPHLEPDTRRC